MLEQRLGIWRFIFTICLPLRLRDVTLNLYDVRHRVGHFDGLLGQFL